MCACCGATLPFCCGLMVAVLAARLLAGLLLVPNTDAWLNDVTFIVPAKQEQPGAVAQTISIDCTSAGGAIQTVSATYGSPCAPASDPCRDPKIAPGSSCSPCEGVKPNNYLQVLQDQCDGKLKCDVSTCPCPKAATCSPDATGCAPEDPAHGYIKGVTVVYHCGPASWGIEFVGLLLFGGAGYLGLGLLYARRVQGRKPAAAPGGGNSKLGALSIHPHASQWAEIAVLVQDGVAYSRGNRKIGSERGVVSRGHHSKDSRREKAAGGSREPAARSTNKAKKSKEKRSRGSEREGLDEPLQPATMAAPAAAATGVGDAKAGMADSAAGGGGRWVHVPG